MFIVFAPYSSESTWISVGVGVPSSVMCVFVNKESKKTRLRKRKRAWYNPPFNCDVRTNIARLFFEALDRNFPRHHKYHRILNRHTVKLSYSTTPNLERIIAGINGEKIKKKDRAGWNGRGIGRCESCT